MHIGQVEKADLEVLAIAAYLHDVGRSCEDESKGTICHATKGAEIAATLLATYPLTREFKLKLSKIKGRMLTAEGRRIAEERHPFMASSRPRARRAEGFRETRHVIPSGQVAVTPRRPPFHPP